MASWIGCSGQATEAAPTVSVAALNLRVPRKTRVGTSVSLAENSAFVPQGPEPDGSLLTLMASALWSCEGLRICPLGAVHC